MDLKRLRIKKRATSEELANLLKISVQAYYKYENGKSEPNIDSICKLADYYHISTDELLGRETNLLNIALLSDKQQNLIKKLLNMNERQLELTEFYI